MKKIAVITAGGTIGSILQQMETNSGQKVRTATIGGAAKLLQRVEGIAAAKGYGMQARPIPPILSELATPAYWLSIAREIEASLADGYTQIVVTHGTDTLHYSAAAVAQLFAKRAARIVITASFFGLDDPRTDAPLNLEAAMATAMDARVEPDVYVTFRAGTEAELDLFPNNPLPDHANIIRAMDLKPLESDQVSASALHNRYYGTYHQGTGIALRATTATTDPSDPRYAFRPAILGGPVPEIIDSNTSNRTLAAELRPGMDFWRLEQFFSPHHDCALILKAYHSGTLPTLDGPGNLMAFMGRNPQVRVILTPYPRKHVAVPYESTAKFIDAGGFVFEDWQPHQVDVLFKLGLAQGHTVDQILKLMDPQRVRLASRSDATEAAPLSLPRAP